MQANQGKFYQSFGRLPSVLSDCEPVDVVLRDSCNADTTLVTGAPLHNLGAAVLLDGFCLGRWVPQGGFAGEGVVPRELQMDKFAGKTTMSTWNFGGNITAAKAALSSAAIKRKVLVSKDVCHRVVYNNELHAGFGEAVDKARAQEMERRAVALGMLHAAMDTYLKLNSGGKKMHEPLALATALDESVCT